MTKHFFTGFVIGLLLFLTINLIAAHFASDCGLPAVFGRDACADDIARAGWPLPFYEEGGFAYRSNFNGPFLFINVVIGFVFSSVVGWYSARRKKALSK